MLKHTLKVKLNEYSYEISIGSDTLAGLGKMVRDKLANSRATIITNPKVEDLFGGVVGDSLVDAEIACDLIQVPDGEEYKNLETAANIYKKLVLLNAHRFDPIIALGGGVIGDLAGFVAATYMRGVPLIQVPTTLLAQVDSSVGGKVGINLPEGKNLVGCFYQPKLVFIDVQVLKELPDKQLKAGLAEVIKYGLIMDAEFLSYIDKNMQEITKRNPEILTEIVKRSCQIKARIVEMDEKDKGIRAILNYGHTIGHALESLSKYREYSHGEAISIGMVGAAILASKLDMIKDKDVVKHKEIFSKAQLPISIEGLSADEIILQMERDKKFSGEENRFVLLENIGKTKVVSQVPWDLVKHSLLALGAS